MIRLGFAAVATLPIGRGMTGDLLARYRQLAVSEAEQTAACVAGTGSERQLRKTREALAALDRVIRCLMR